MQLDTISRGFWNAGLLAFILASAIPATGQSLDLILPTSNDALLQGDGPEFYMYTNRNFNGIRSRPWEGGQYGYVRNPKNTREGIVYTRFHEGVDIRPLYRDARGEPLDTVRSIDLGYVVYTNTVEAHSSYGKYVVVEHWWSGSPFYSLYAHLSRIDVVSGQRVRQGDRLGQVGHTGPGLNRTRAHLHFEINLMLNQYFDEWFSSHYRSTNRHDVFNGINLVGIDVSALYLELQDNPALTIDEFLKNKEPFFSIAVPGAAPLDLAHRYGWLVETRFPWQLVDGIGSWEIALTSSGVPIRIEPSSRSITEPTVTTVRRSGISYADLTSGRLTGNGDRFGLSPTGSRYAALLSMIGEGRLIVHFEQPSRDVGDGGDRLRTW